MAQVPDTCAFCLTGNAKFCKHNTFYNRQVRNTETAGNRRQIWIK